MKIPIGCDSPTFNLSTLKITIEGVLWVPGQPGLKWETLSQKIKQAIETAQRVQEMAVQVWRPECDP